MATEVPMSHPATAVKNTDGTWSVRIQHTAEGQVTNVDFTNVLFAEVLAKGYAAMLNGEAVVEAQLGKIASDLGPAITGAKEDVKKIIAEAETEASKLLTAAKAEAVKIKTDAQTLAASAKTEAEGLKTKADEALAVAEAEAKKLVEEARTKASEILAAASAKIKPTPAPQAPKSTTVEDE